MVEYTRFKEYMKYIRKLDSAANICLSRYKNDDDLYDAITVDYLCEALTDLFEDKHGWLSHYIYSCECDYDNACAKWYDMDNEEHDIDGDKELYMLITGEIEASEYKLEPTYCLTDEGRAFLEEYERNHK